MKKQKSLLALALAGAAVAFTTGCSSTSMHASNTGNQTDAYRYTGASGWTPITDIREMNKFPMEWNPVWYSTTTFAVPVKHPEDVSVASSELPTFSNDLQPGDVFVEAAGGRNPGRVKEVILYTPFGGH